MSNKNVTAAALSGAAAAAVVGTAVYMMNDKSGRNVHKVKRSAAKTVHAVGNIVNGISEMIH